MRVVIAVLLMGAIQFTMLFSTVNEASADLAGRMLKEVGSKPIAGRAWCGKYLRRHAGAQWSAVAHANLRVGRSCACKRNSIVVFKHSHVGVITGKCSATACPVVSGNARGGRVSSEWRRRSTIRGCRC